MTIHYCWLGRGEKPEKVKYCIESWKRLCPSFTIKEWNEDNYDINVNAYVKAAYEQKKYAFASDYIRFDVLRREGGVYLDTDVELIKDITSLCGESFLALERGGEVNPGLIMCAAAPDEPIFCEILAYYDSLTDFSTDKTVVDITSEILRKHGLEGKDEEQTVGGVKIYPTEYFNPKGADYGKEKITDKTYSIHHYMATWKSPDDQLLMRYKVKYGTKKGKILFSLRHPFLALKKVVKK